jgi:3-polyprenyl-4-hydroxybenzoate decarboxylase
MSYDGLRDWLAQVDAIGELRTLEEIDWNLEMGAVIDVLYREHPPLSTGSGFRQDQGPLNRS